MKYEVFSNCKNDLVWIGVRYESSLCFGSSPVRVEREYYVWDHSDHFLPVKPVVCAIRRLDHLLAAL